MEREQRLRYASHDAQLFGVSAYERMDGAARGARISQVVTGGGLSYDVLPDNAMDILGVSYKGVNVSYLSKVGHTSDYYLHEDDFANYFSGGMLYTCGLLSTGPSGYDKGVYHPLHGRLHALRAENCSARAGEDGIELLGTMREAALFGHCLRLRRRIYSPAFSAEILIEDLVENLMPEPVELMLLYHMNFGYPFLSEHLQLELPEGTKTTPRTPFAAEAMDSVGTFSPPVDGLEERVYFHDIPAQEGMSSVTLKNPALGFGARVQCNKDALPYIVQWKSMKSGDYALGIEPSNSRIMGRSAERENGTLRTLPAYGSERFTVRLSFFDL